VSLHWSSISNKRQVTVINTLIVDNGQNLRLLPEAMLHSLFPISFILISARILMLKSSKAMSLVIEKSASIGGDDLCLWIRVGLLLDER
jgi:hypothetical protein